MTASLLEQYLQENPTQADMGAFEVAQRFEEWKIGTRRLAFAEVPNEGMQYTAELARAL